METDDDMKLPEGKTAESCGHFYRCSKCLDAKRIILTVILGLAGMSSQNRSQSLTMTKIEKLIKKYSDELIVLRDNLKHDTTSNYPYEHSIKETMRFIRDLKKLEPRCKECGTKEGETHKMDCGSKKPKRVTPPKYKRRKESYDFGK